MCMSTYWQIRHSISSATVWILCHNVMSVSLDVRDIDDVIHGLQRMLQHRVTRQPRVSQLQTSKV